MVLLGGSWPILAVIQKPLSTRENEFSWLLSHVYLVVVV